MSNEIPLRILIHGLFHRVVNTQGIDARCARLHLHLGVVNARFKVDEQVGQVLGRVPPMQPQIVRGKGHQHGAHTEIDPTRLNQIAHAGIDKGVAGLSGLPSAKFRIVEVLLA